MSAVPRDGVEFGRTIFQRYSASRGRVQELHFPERDKIMCRFPCFRTTARVDGGMSGGPVMRGDGGVIGVFCSSYGNQEQQDHVSYVSLIGPALLLQLKTGPDERRFLYDFVVGGAVSADETLSSLQIARDEDSLELDFGLSPTLRGVLGD